MKVTNDNWPIFARSIATDGDPTQHSPAAMERLVRHMSKHIFHVRVPHGKFRNNIRTELCDFKSEADRQYYNLAYERYCEECAKIQKEVASGRWAKAVATNKFRYATEVVKVGEFVPRMVADVNTGYAAMAACCFKYPIIKAVRMMVKDFGINRDDISIIWGGDDSSDKSKRLSPEQLQKYMFAFLKGEEIPKKILKLMEKQIRETAEETSLAETDYGQDLRLGAQSREERQREIDRYQSGKTRFAFFTFAAGGTGLSLHHAEYNEQGLFTKDILVSRRSYLTPPYSAQDLVQGFGRAHRTVFSMSDTIQTILFYRGTVEELVMATVALKLKCLGKTLSQRESWLDILDEKDIRGRIDQVKAEFDLAKQDEEEYDLNDRESDEDEDE